MNNWETQLRSVLKDHLEHESTIGAVIAIYRAVRTSPRLLSSEPSEEDISDAARCLLDNAFMMQTNPFMGMFGVQMNTVYQLAVNAYTDSFSYYSENAQTPETQAENTLRHFACKNTVHEITMTAVLCERGFAYHRGCAIELRNRLYAIEGIL